MTIGNEMVVKKIVRYRTKCWYQATIDQVEDTIEPNFQDETLRVKIIFKVKRSRNSNLAHLYIRFGEKWGLEPQQENLLEQLISSHRVASVMDQFNQLKGQKCQVMFDAPLAIGQKQSIIDIKNISNMCPKRIYKPSWENCALLLDISEGIIKSWKSNYYFRTLKLEEIPTSVRCVIFLFWYLQQKEEKLTAENYTRSKTLSNQVYKTPEDALRKAINRTRDWLNDLDRRRNWGRAIEGTPKRGYKLKIRILQFRSDETDKDQVISESCF